MYIWNIKALKQDLQADTLGEKAKFVYMFISALIFTAILEISSRIPSEVDYSEDVGWIIVVVDMLVAVLGMICAFRANGGSCGRDFLGKYFSISFVVGIRFIPLGTALIVLAGVINGAFAVTQYEVSDALGSDIIFEAVGTLIMALFYWRICKHIADIRVDIEPTETEGVKKPSWLFYVLAFLLCSPIVGLMAIGAYIGNSAPPSYVVAGTELSQDRTDLLREYSVVEEQETIVFFYSSGIFSLLESGTILTEERIVSYIQNADTQEMIVSAVAYSDIAKMYLSSKGDGMFEDTMIDVYRANDEYALSLVLSAEKNGDEPVIRMLTSKTGLELLDYEDSEGIAIYDELPVDDEVDENPESVEPQGEAIE
ncbi:MAG: hypothetical protein ACRBCK_01085 [Alphaproteobacteria bacterium]